MAGLYDHDRFTTTLALKSIPGWDVVVEQLPPDFKGMAGAGFSAVVEATRGAPMPEIFEGRTGIVSKDFLQALGRTAGHVRYKHGMHGVRVLSAAWAAAAHHEHADYATMGNAGIMRARLDIDGEEMQEELGWMLSAPLVKNLQTQVKPLLHGRSTHRLSFA